jgi:Transposase IS66 family
MRTLNGAVLNGLRYNQLYLAARSPGPIREAACWAHGRRPFFAMADIEENARRKAAGKKEIVLSPIAIEIVRRIDALFEIERAINGKSAEERLVVRRALSRPLVEDLHAYMQEQLAKLSRGHDLAKAFNDLSPKVHPAMGRILFSFEVLPEPSCDIGCVECPPARSHRPHNGDQSRWNLSS